MSSTTVPHTRATFELRDLIALALFGWLACVGFGLQTMFFGMAAAQFGAWLPVTVLLVCTASPCSRSELS